MTLYNKNNPAAIQSMFNGIAKNYDRANAVLSFNLHKLWNRSLVRRLGSECKSHTFLDLCSGTGDIALNYLALTKFPCKVYLIDFSSSMLDCAKNKIGNTIHSKQHEVEYREADVENLPLRENYADCAAMAYGIRNVKNPYICLQEIYRVLKPGGKLGLLELTRPENKALRFGHFLYLKSILPLLGRLVTNNIDAYNYLQNSIQAFISPLELESMMKEIGYKKTERIPLTGGIATIITGTKIH